MQRAFSLVELSIVLVILGLLTGGILAGQSLIRAAEVRQYTTQAANYTTAVRIFQDRYFALPGDMRNATSFWGRDDTADTMCAGHVGTPSPTGTCNGNANGIVNETTLEIATAWRHLSLSGLIAGDYNGHFTNPHVAGVDVPPALDGWWTLYAEGDDAIYSVEKSTRTKLVTGGSASLLRPEEAWGIDLKMDDGVAGSGSVIATGSNCVDGPRTQTSPVVQYVLTMKDKACRPHFYIQ